MATLLLQCIGPLQSWGTQSHFSVRDTEREPTKSGIVGILCAALGRPRTASIDDLVSLRMGVRVDKEGTILRDWHTAGKGGYLRASGKIEKNKLITSTRYYLTDAAFLVGLNGDDLSLLQQLHRALGNPHWALCLGRKSCPPSLPLYLKDGLQDTDLLTALTTYPWLGSDRQQHAQMKRLRVVIEDPTGPRVCNDHPISFENGRRRYAPRRTRTEFIPVPSYREPLVIDLEVS